MNRRRFIQTAGAVGVGLAIGLPGALAQAEPIGPAKIGSPRLLSKLNYPTGGCSESGNALFEKGPFGKDPFRLYS